MITGQTLTPLVSYGGNAKSESRHFQDLKSLMVCKTRGFILTGAEKGCCEKEVQVQGHISSLPEFCHDSSWQANMHLITCAFPFVGRWSRVKGTVLLLSPLLCVQLDVTRSGANSALTEE